MLDDLYKTAVVTITSKYVENQADTPAAAVAKEVFAAMHKKGWHNCAVGGCDRPPQEQGECRQD